MADSPDLKSLKYDSSTLSEGSVLVLNNSTVVDGSPVVTTLDDVNKSIPETNNRDESCGNCSKTPDLGQVFAHCSKCRGTRYCSRGCQVTHWPEHKAICKQRLKAVFLKEKAKHEARAKGQVHYDPSTLQSWYKLNYETVEHAALHVLELWKGPGSSKQSTHFALFTVEVDETNPDDPKLVRFKDVVVLPMDKLQSIGSVPDRGLERAIENGSMVLVFLDVKHNLRVLEFHKSPSSEPYLKGEKQPDEMWQVHTVFKLNSHLPAMDS